MNVAPFPTHIQIQTTTACGADCTICPHPQKAPTWSNGPMADGLFDRIVDQLRGRHVEYLCPYLMADGLSDRKIFDRLAVLRSALPAAHFEVSTTGMYLVPKIADRLLDAPISELRISSHGISREEYATTMPGVDFDRAMANIRRFIDRWKTTRPFKLSIVSLWGLWSRQREREIESYWSALGIELSKWRVITRARQVDLTVFGSAGDDAVSHVRDDHQGPCACRFNRDTQWMHILSDGRVTLCCMDYGQEQILGDASRDSLERIWHSAAFETVRARIRGDVATDSSFLCNRCEWRVSASRNGDSAKGKLTAVIAAS